MNTLIIEQWCNDLKHAFSKWANYRSWQFSKSFHHCKNQKWN